MQGGLVSFELSLELTKALLVGLWESGFSGDLRIQQDKRVSNLSFLSSLCIRHRPVNIHSSAFQDIQQEACFAALCIG